MINAVHKYIFIGLQKEIHSFLAQAQTLGIIEFIIPKVKDQVVSDSISDLLQAIKILAKQPKIDPIALDRKELEEKITHIIELQQNFQKAEELHKSIIHTIHQTAPLGDFSVDDIEEIASKTGKKIQFFQVKKSQLSKLPETWLYIGQELGNYYYMSFMGDVPPSGMVTIPLKYSLSTLRVEKERLDSLQNQLKKSLEQAAAYLPSFEMHLLEQLNQMHFEEVKDHSSRPLGNHLFALQGWIPENHIETIKREFAKTNVYIEKVSTEVADRVPTYMNNTDIAKLGEDLVHVYDIPSPYDVDPSLWVFWFFVIFFSMIVADAGYGFVFFAGAIVAKKYWKNLEKAQERYLRLFRYLSIGCILWGAAIGSYFGITLSPESALKSRSISYYLAKQKASYHIDKRDMNYQKWIQKYPKLQTESRDEILTFKQSKDGKVSYPILSEIENTVLLEIALLVGVIHISLSLLRYAKRHFPNFGWCITILGGYLYCAQFLQATSLLYVLGIIPEAVAKQIGMQLLLFGSLVTISCAFIQHRMKGLFEIVHGVQIFADILSYLRIYALGIAAMIMANTFNWLGSKVGFIGGTLIILFGHCTNIILAIMGGVIHGLRLNFIEWYHYSFQGDGKLFRPLQLKKKIQ
ncbi:MAG: hypothetical protein ACRCSV_01835 [Chlamydiales bacterium]